MYCTKCWWQAGIYMKKYDGRFTVDQKKMRLADIGKIAPEMWKGLLLGKKEGSKKNHYYVKIEGSIGLTAFEVEMMKRRVATLEARQ